jgi:hypothetical protein
VGPAVGTAVTDLETHDAPHPAKPVPLVEHAPFDGGHQSPTAVRRATPAVTPAESAPSRLAVNCWEELDGQDGRPILCP